MTVLTKLARLRDKRITHDKTGQQMNDQLADLIRQAFDQGLTGPQIAAAAGISQSRVYQIKDSHR